MSPRLEREAAMGLDLEAVLNRLQNPSKKGRPVRLEALLKAVAYCLENPTDDCVIFQGHLNKDGYGTFRFRDTHYTAHRTAYLYANGARPADIAGFVVRHMCDNPPCINPTHLELGTQADNVRDMHQRGRYKAPPSGEASVVAKLTNEQVAFIRNSYGRRGIGGISQKDLAALFNVSYDLVHRIVNNSAWRHV